MLTTPCPLRLTPPQRRVLHLLHTGWQCATCTPTPGPFHKLLSYAFRRGDEATQYVSGTTLRSLEARQLIRWEPCAIEMRIDHSMVPGAHLTLTPPAIAWVEQHHPQPCV